MKTDFFPGFKVTDGEQPPAGVVLFETEKLPTQKNEALAEMPGNLSPVARVTNNAALYDARFGDFTARVERFARSLSHDQLSVVS